MTLMPVSKSWSSTRAGRRPGLAVDRPALGDLDLLAGLAVQHLADDVEDLALGDVADGHRDRLAGVADLLAADQPSVGFSAIARTRSSPRCCATSSVIVVVASPRS
jgi:hypothetical protein